MLGELGRGRVEVVVPESCAVDLEDRVEAFNTPLKLMSPIRFQGPLEDPRGKKLAEVLPPDLAEQLDHLRVCPPSASP